MSQHTSITPVPSLDLNRYLGRWYEICRLPLKWEDAGATDITANYSLQDDGNVRVDNRCFNDEGQPSRSIGEAVPIDETNARLKVSFLPEFLRWVPFTDGDYWVLKLDPDYQVALVGTPDHRNLWVLSRTPSLPQDILDQYLAEARRQGFDLSALITPRHTGREVTNAMLEKAS
jgi:apolipoprotein D and lipocalin family protein